MAKFRFRLTTLMRLRQIARDERRQELAALQQLEQSINDQITSLDSQMAELRRRSAAMNQAGSIDVDRLRETVRYQSLLAARRQAALVELENCSTQVHRLRQSLVKADRELKSLEKLQSRQQDRYLKTERKRELRQLDEAGLRIVATRDSGI